MDMLFGVLGIGLPGFPKLGIQWRRKGQRGFENYRRFLHLEELSQLFTPLLLQLAVDATMVGSIVFRHL